MQYELEKKAERRAASLSHQICQLRPTNGQSGLKVNSRLTGSSRALAASLRQPWEANQEMGSVQAVEEVKIRQCTEEWTWRESEESATDDKHRTYCSKQLSSTTSLVLHFVQCRYHDIFSRTTTPKQRVKVVKFPLLLETETVKLGPIA